jgi:hypothetical protein
LGVFALSVELDVVGIGRLPFADVLAQSFSIRAAPFTKVLAAPLLCSLFRHTLYWIPFPTYWSFSLDIRGVLAYCASICVAPASMNESYKPSVISDASIRVACVEALFQQAKEQRKREIPK